MIGKNVFAKSKKIRCVASCTKSLMKQKTICREKREKQSKLSFFPFPLINLLVFPAADRTRRNHLHREKTGNHRPRSDKIANRLSRRATFGVHGSSSADCKSVFSNPFLLSPFFPFRRLFHLLLSRDETSSKSA